jgi:hypothetical protein
MSTKTIKQRIAVVAVSALTAGLISVVAAPSANASAGNGGISVTASTGTITAPAVNGGSTSGTGAISITGNVSFTVTGASAVYVEARVAGGTFTSVSGNAVATSADNTIAYNTALGGTSSTMSVSAKPTTAGRNMVITTYQASTRDGVAQSSTVVDTLTITVVAAGASGVVSSSNSFIQILNAASTVATATSNTDVSPYAAVVSNGGFGVISVLAKDGANNNMPATATLAATVKSGACLVHTSSSGATITSVSQTNVYEDIFYVVQADSTNLPPALCTVEISVNGTVIGQKTLLFQGPVAKIKVANVGRAANSGTETASGIGTLTVEDAAGNSIGAKAVTGYVVNAADSNLITAVGTVTTSVGSASVNGGTNAGTTPSNVAVTCGVTSTATPVKIQYKISNGIGGFIYSDILDMYCTGSPVNYKASLDKATYSPGDVATLTITATDSKGNPVNDASTLGAGSTITVAGGVLTAVTAPASLDTFGGGKATYKYTVGSTGGAYNLVVDLTARNSTTYNQSAVTVPYTVKTTGATNEDVLKSIVALIASINKQIQALQKLILRR